MRFLRPCKEVRDEDEEEEEEEDAGAQMTGGEEKMTSWSDEYFLGTRTIKDESRLWTKIEMTISTPECVAISNLQGRKRLGLIEVIDA